MFWLHIDFKILTDPNNAGCEEAMCLLNYLTGEVQASMAHVHVNTECNVIFLGSARQKVGQQWQHRVEESSWCWPDRAASQTIEAPHGQRLQELWVSSFACYPDWNGGQSYQPIPLLSSTPKEKKIYISKSQQSSVTDLWTKHDSMKKLHKNT